MRVKLYVLRRKFQKVCIFTLFQPSLHVLGTAWRAESIHFYVILHPHSIGTPNQVQLYCPQPQRSKQPKTAPGSTRQPKTAPDSFRLTQIAQDSPRQPQIVPNSTIQPQTAPESTREPQIVPDSPRQHQTDTDSKSKQAQVGPDQNRIGSDMPRLVQIGTGKGNFTQAR